VIKGFMLQTGDPKGDGTGGESIWGREFEDEFVKTLRYGAACSAWRHFSTSVVCGSAATDFGRGSVAAAAELTSHVHFSPAKLSFVLFCFVLFCCY
jgi:cyclophilin family peptidyl-prolyl cis-trans isomerase